MQKKYFLSQVADKFPKTCNEFKDWYNSYTRTHAPNIKLKMPKMLGRDDVYTWPLFDDLPYEFQYSLLLAFFAHKQRMIFLDKDAASVFFMKLFEYVEYNISDNERECCVSDGARMIYKERIEQITKHGYDVDSDKANDNGELIRAAAALLLDDVDIFPSWWDNKFFYRTINRDKRERYAIAGALVAAQIDFINEEKKLDNGIQNGD